MDLQLDYYLGSYMNENWTSIIGILLDSLNSIQLFEGLVPNFKFYVVEALVSS